MFLLLLPPLLNAAEQIAVNARFIESTKGAIPHDMAKLANNKDFNVMNAPTLIAKLGEQAQMDISREHQPASIAHSGFKPIPVGVTIRVTPHLKDDEIAFTARITISELIINKALEGQTSSEISSRDLYVSAVTKHGEEVWFDYLDPNSENKITVWIQFSTI